jgi:hypothetical protein
VSPSSAIKWMQRRQATRNIAPEPSGVSISPLEAHAAVLFALIAQQPELTLDETVRRCTSEGSLAVAARSGASYSATRSASKKGCGRRSKSGLSWHVPGGAGCESEACLTQPDWWFSMASETRLISRISQTRSAPFYARANSGLTALALLKTDSSIRSSHQQVLKNAVSLASCRDRRSLQ